MNYAKFKPAVHRKSLIQISELMWSGVGIFLNILVFGWFKNLNNTQILLSILIGLFAEWVIHSFGFGNLAIKNVNRILAYPKHACIFAFQEWKSYILIAIMMIIGILMRTTSLLPKYLLAPMFIGIGIALFLVSFKYYRNLN